MHRVRKSTWQPILNSLELKSLTNRKFFIARFCFFFLQIFYSTFGWKFRGILGNFFGGWEILEWNLKGLLGPWKWLEFWEVSSLHCSLAKTQNRPSKKPQEFQPLSRISKKSLDKSRFPVPENLPFEPSWVGRDCSIHPLEKNPNPRNDSSIFHSSPVQEQSSPQILQKLTANQMLLPKNPRLDPRKISIKTCLVLRNFCRKKLDSPGWLKGW